jgi:hypothetical protein
MKKVAIVILGIFFIALTTNAFAGDIVGDLRNALGGAQSAAYNTILVKPYQMGASLGQTISPHINNIYNAGLGIGNTITTALTTPGIRTLASIDPGTKNYIRNTILGALNQPTYLLYNVNPGAGRFVRNAFYGTEKPEKIGCYMTMSMRETITVTPISPAGNSAPAGNKSASTSSTLKMPKVNTNIF